MLENIQQIRELLNEFQGIEPLRKLFWVELNYNRENTPIDNLPESAASLVAADPLHFATGGKDSDFYIIYVQLKTEKLRKTDERQIITHLQTRYPDALYVFSNSRQDYWHFINVKLTREKQEKTEQPERDVKQRNLFRRITIAPDERLRTAAERIAMLDLKELGEEDTFFKNSELLTALEIRKGHEEAFNVEAVTEAFFEDYKRVFEKLQDELDKQTSDEKWAHDYAQQFLSRCLFLYFVQRKRWLGDDPDFLRTFWETYQNTDQPADTFVAKWLNVLFFEAFNNRPCNGYRYLSNKLREILQLSPYLNGGLFRKNALDTDYIVNVQDDLWQEIFTFFEQYNFTIAEDTPLDQEVAVDPEMIGKVYESLVSVEDEEKGDAGIFYTPRVEIDLMCRLALVDNLANHIGTEDDKHLFYEVLFAFDPDEKTEADAKLSDLWEPIHKHLTEITVVDPACGSGSFLVGMLHVLDDIRERAERHLGINESSRFERRKALIGKNLYGVDVKQWACKVAELRLWLALIIDAEFTIAELNVRTEPLLPDFSFNIRHGDSIVQDIGGMNLAQIRAIDSGVPSGLKRKITNLQTEKLKFYNGEEDRQYAEKDDVQEAEHGLFQELLQGYEVQISKDIRAIKAWLEDPAEQLTLAGMSVPEDRQLDFETLQKQQELKQYEENQRQVKRARETLSSKTTAPFVWDIAFVEIFSQRKGFDIVIENPPYIRQEDIRDLMLPRDDGMKTANKKLYKAKLTRSVYQVHPEFFGYQSKKDIKPDKPESAVKNKLSGRSDLYVYFYFHGLSLLNPKGSLCTITSNSWLDVAYGAKLQEFLLTQCHLKLVLDNSVKRSFKGVNINTVIALTSAPNKDGELNLHSTARFVNFTVPFEAILDPIIFYEIETAARHVITQEHRIHSLFQKNLLADGREKKKKYAGDKWGGKYLRAPDIYWHILERGKGKLKRVSDASDTIRMGIKTGANKFFVLDQAAISMWNIESDFLQPVIVSAKDSKSLLVTRDRLSHSLFLCSEKRASLKNSAALAYIEWGETQNFHTRPSTRYRQEWYDLGNLPSPSLSFPQLIGPTAKTMFAPNGCWTLDNFTEIHAPSILAIPLCLCLNSTLFQLMLNLSGCANRGYGFLKVQTSDLENLLCVDPKLVIMERVNQAVLESEDWDVLEPSPARRYIDNVIFDILELTQGERDGVYESVIQLVTTRLQKAKSV